MARDTREEHPPSTSVCSYRTSFTGASWRQADHDIVISRDLLMELAMLPPTAIDLHFDQGHPAPPPTPRVFPVPTPRVSPAPRIETGGPMIGQRPLGATTAAAAHGSAGPTEAGRGKAVPSPLPRIPREGRRPLQR